MNETAGQEISTEDAVCSWYDEIYLPIVRIARDRGILKRFPGRTEADIYLWVMVHRDELIEREDHDVGPEEAIIDLAEELDEQRMPFGLDRFFRMFKRDKGLKP